MMNSWRTAGKRMGSGNGWKVVARGRSNGGNLSTGRESGAGDQVGDSRAAGGDQQARWCSGPGAGGGFSHLQDSRGGP